MLSIRGNDFIAPCTKKIKNKNSCLCTFSKSVTIFSGNDAHHKELVVKEWYEKKSWETPNKATANQRMPRNSQLLTQELNTV
jgi:hypothetical protein